MVCIRIFRGYFGAHHASSCISALLFDGLFLITGRALVGRVLDVACGERLWPRRPSVPFVCGPPCPGSARSGGTDDPFF